MIVCMENLRKLGVIIKERLGERSQSWLSRQSGVDQSTISRILNGKVVPTPETLEAIGEALGLHPTHLMQLAWIPEATQEYDPEAAHLARQLTALPPSVRRQAIDALRAQLDTIYKVAGITPQEINKSPIQDNPEVQTVITELLRLAQEKPEALRQVMEQVQMLQQGKASSEG